MNIRGADEVLKSTRAAMAFAFYRPRGFLIALIKKFDHFEGGAFRRRSKMIRSDLSCSGVMFTLDTESGFRDTVLINGSWGLGEMIVQGEVTPDEFLIFKKH